MPSPFIENIRKSNPEDFADFSDKEIADALYEADPRFHEFSLPEFYKAAGVQKEYGLTDFAKDIWTQITDAPTHTAGAIASAIEGDKPFTEDNFLDILVRESEARAKRRAEEAQIYGDDKALGMFTAQDVAGLGSSLGYSAATMGTAAASGIGGSLAVGPLTGYAAASAASYNVAQRASANQFIRDVVNTVDQEKRAAGQEPLTQEEKLALQEELQGPANISGRWEAIPETAGNLLGFKIISAPVKSALGKLFGEKLAMRTIGKLAALYGTELTQELVTQQGQYNVMADVTGKKPRSWTSGEDLGTSFKEVAPMVVLQTSLMAPFAKGGHMLYKQMVGEEYVKSKNKIPDLPTEEPTTPTPETVPTEGIKGEEVQPEEIVINAVPPEASTEVQTEAQTPPQQMTDVELIESIMKTAEDQQKDVEERQAAAEEGLLRIEGLINDRAEENVGLTPEAYPLPADKFETNINESEASMLQSLPISAGEGHVAKVNYPEVMQKTLTFLNKNIKNLQAKGTYSPTVAILQDAVAEAKSFLQEAQQKNWTPYQLRAALAKKSNRFLRSAVGRAVGGRLLDQPIKGGRVLVAGFPTTLKKKPWQAPRVKESIKLLEKWTKIFAPTEEVVLVDSRAAGRAGLKFSKEHYGGYLGRRHGRHYLRVNFESYEQNPKGRRSLNAFNTLAHEFGHLLAHVYLQEELRGMDKAGTEKVVEALKAEHRKFINKMTKDVTYRKFRQLRGGPGARDSIWNRARSLELNADFRNEHAQEKFTSEAKAEEGRVYLLSFEEFLAERIGAALMREEARTADDTLTPIFSRIAQKLKRFYRRFARQYDNTTADLWVKSLSLKHTLEKLHAQAAPTEKLSSENIEDVKSGLKDVYKGLDAQDMSDQDLSKPAESIARMNSFMRYALSLTQVEQLNKQVPGVVKFVEGVRAWWNEKGVWTRMANERVQEFEHFGKEELYAFSRFAHEVTLLSDKKERKLKTEELAELAQKFNVSDRALETWQRTQRDFDSALLALQEVLIADARRRFRHLSPEQRLIEIEKAVEKIKQEFRVLRNRDYWPLSRFGKYWVHLIAGRDTQFDGKPVKAGETVLFEVYETEKEARKRRAQLAASFKGHHAGSGLLEDNTFQFQGMPPSLIKSIKGIISSELDTMEGLSPEEQDAHRANVEEKLTAFDQLLHELAPGQSYKHRMQRRKGTAGYSLDAVRGYANYFMHFANHISRIKHYAELMDAIAEVRQHMIHAGHHADVTQEGRLLEYLKRAYDYAMNPGDEWANLRSFGFSWYLGFLPKSAFVNLTQVPLVTYPHLAARYGDYRAVKELTKASKDLKKMWTQGTQLEGHLVRAMQDVWPLIEESLATELAGAAEGSNLQRLMPGSFLKSEKAARAVRKVGSAAAFLFQKAEKVNRLATFTAAYRLEMADLLNGRDYEKLGQAEQDALRKKAMLVGREAMEQTQFEYARWNRPPFMRGKSSVFFLFKQYLQNSLFFLYHDPGRSRYMLMLLAMSGVMGLPGAEDIDDLIGAIASALTGKKVSPKELLRELLNENRELLDKMNASPDLILHGGLKGLFGTDVSGSISMGHILPGAPAVAKMIEGSQDIRDVFMELSEDVGGPVPAIATGVMKAMTSDSTNEWRKWEQAMPAVVKSVSRATRWAAEGVETDASGDPIAEFDFENPVHTREAILQALGFPSERIRDIQSMRWEQREHMMFWKARESTLKRDLAAAIFAHDREAKADVLRRIRRYNDTVPFSGMRINSKQLERSIKARAKNRLLKKKGLPVERKYTELYKDIERSWEESLR